MAVDNFVLVGSTVSADKYNRLAIAASRIVARLASGDVKACTPAEILTLIAGQPADATLTALAGMSTAANKIPYFTNTDVASLLDLVTTVADPGVDTELPTGKAVRTALNAKQASDATLTALAGMSTAASKVPYFTNTDVAALLDLVTSVADPGTDAQVPTAKAVRDALNAKANLVGSADIEIQAAAKGLILRTGDGHRARLTLSGTTPTYTVSVADLGAA